MKKILFTILFLLPLAASATMSVNTRVFYRPDGSVMPMRLDMERNCPSQSEPDCFKQQMINNPSWNSLPHDDVPTSQLPDWTQVSKWRGAKGQAVWVDNMLVLKQDEIDKLTKNLDDEFAASSPDPVKVAQLQRSIEKVNGSNLTVFAPNDLSAVEVFRKKDSSLLASVAGAVGDFISSAVDAIKSGFLKLVSLVTDSLQVGSADKPSGITTYDQVTKLPYCLEVVNGQVQGIPGVCGSQISTMSTQATTTPTSTSTSTPDIIPPIITLNGDNPTTIHKGDSFVDLGAIVADNVDHNLGVTVTGDIVNTERPGTYHIYYNTTDTAGNVAAQVTRTVKVVGQNSSAPASTSTPVVTLDTATTTTDTSVASTTNATSTTP